MKKRWKKQLVILCSALMLAANPVIVGATGTENVNNSGVENNNNADSGSNNNGDTNNGDSSTSNNEDSSTNNNEDSSTNNNEDSSTNNNGDSSTNNNGNSSTNNNGNSSANNNGNSSTNNNGNSNTNNNGNNNSGNNEEDDDKDSPLDYEEVGSASLVVSDNSTPSGQNGKDMQVKVTLKNLGDGAASNVSVRPVIKTGTDSPFEPKNVGIKTIRYIDSDGGTGTASFTLTVKEKAVTGYYSVDFSVVYYDEGSSTNRSMTVTSYVFIEGLDESETSTETDINISLRNSPTPSSSSFNCPIKFDLFLNNFGVSDAYSVTITPVISAKTSEYPFEIEQASYEKALPAPLLGTKSQPDEGARNQVVHYSLNVRNDVTTGYYPVVFKIAAKDENGKEYKTEQTVFFNIKGNPKYEETTTETTTPEETTKTSVPRLIVTGYETDLETVNAGDSFRLIIRVKNTSAVTSVSNVKFTLSATDDAFLPVSGSSTLFVSHIGTGQTVDLEVDMTAKASLEAKSYPLTLEAEYEDSKVNAYTAKESISIPVSQEIRMSIGEIEIMPSELEVGSQANIMFPVNNMGKSKIYNVTITFEGDTVTGGETFKGNIDSGATANVDVMLTAAAATMDDPIVYAIVTYEDDKGKQYEMKKSFELYVYEPYIDDGSWQDIPVMDDVPPEEPESSMPKWAVPAGIGAAVVVIIAVIVVIRRKRKKAEGMDDDEIL